MTSIILISCGASFIFLGVTLFAAKSKTFRKVLNKWLNRVPSSEESASVIKDEIPMEDTVEPEPTHIEQKELGLGMSAEYPVVEDGNGGRFIFVTLVRPPAKDFK